jgi:hypothetical protein
MFLAVSMGNPKTTIAHDAGPHAVRVMEAMLIRQ